MSTSQINESVFTWAAPPLKFGNGSLKELPSDIRTFGAQSCLIITDAHVRATGTPDEVLELLQSENITADIFDEVGIEPTNESIDHAVGWARQRDWDCFVAIGGGSVIDTTKAINLLTTHPGELLDYVTPPIGKGD